MELNPEAQFAQFLRDDAMQDMAMIEAVHAAFRDYDDDYDRAGVVAAEELGMTGMAFEIIHELHEAGYRITKVGKSIEATP